MMISPETFAIAESNYSLLTFISSSFYISSFSFRLQTIKKLYLRLKKKLPRLLLKDCNFIFMRKLCTNRFGLAYKP